MPAPSPLFFFSRLFPFFFCHSFSILHLSLPFYACVCSTVPPRVFFHQCPSLFFVLLLPPFSHSIHPLSPRIHRFFFLFLYSDPNSASLSLVPPPPPPPPPFFFFIFLPSFFPTPFWTEIISFFLAYVFFRLTIAPFSFSFHPSPLYPVFCCLIFSLHRIPPTLSTQRPLLDAFF